MILLCFISSDYDYDYEEPKKEAKAGKCGKGNRCGKAGPKEGKKGIYLWFFIELLISKKQRVESVEIGRVVNVDMSKKDSKEKRYLKAKSK